MMSYFKIWLKVIRKNLSIKTLLVFFIEHLVLYLAIFFLFGDNIILSFILLLLLMIIRSVIRLFVFYKKLVDSGNFDQILLKPIDPLFGLIVFKMNLADIVILLPVLIFLKLKNKRYEK